MLTDPEPQRRRPAYIGANLPVPTAGLPETKPFPLIAPQYSEDQLALPTPYNADYPHPITVYAGPGVNPATVAASEYAPMLHSLMKTNPKVMMGTILAECGKPDVTAPALTLQPGNKDGCGIPERFWLRLATWAAVKVPLGTVVPTVPSAHGVAPRFAPNHARPLPSPAWSLSGSTGTQPATPFDHLPDTPVSRQPSPARFGHGYGHGYGPGRLTHSRSQWDLRQQPQPPRHHHPGSDMAMHGRYELQNGGQRRGEFPQCFRGSKLSGSLPNLSRPLNTTFRGHHRMPSSFPEPRQVAPSEPINWRGNQRECSAGRWTGHVQKLKLTTSRLCP
jgi:hypothetical protein